MRLEDEYYTFLLTMIDPRRELVGKFMPVIEELYLTDFRWSDRFSDDENRAKDGMGLRNIFAETKGVRAENICGGKKCSCLEVLIGLARRIEIDIMGIPGEENIPRWFWMFIDSIGFVSGLFGDQFQGDLSDLEPGMWDRAYIDRKIGVWLDRNYDRTGRGGIFVIDYPPFDPKRKTIWAQMNAYLYLLERNESCEVV